jgi:RNA polymerase sigma-70 factor (ECF subfamily)
MDCSRCAERASNPEISVGWHLEADAQDPCDGGQQQSLRRCAAAAPGATAPTPLPRTTSSDSPKEWRTTEFDRLVALQIPALQRYARALTRDRDRADDLVQACLTRALAKQHLWSPDTDARAWLFAVLHNMWVSEQRRRVREQNHQRAVVALLTPAPIRPDGLLELRDVDRAIGKLPDQQRQVLVMVAIESMDYRQVAASLDLPIGTVRSRLGRARATLRIELNRPLVRPLSVSPPAPERELTGL